MRDIGPVVSSATIANRLAASAKSLRRSTVRDYTITREVRTRPDRPVDPWRPTDRPSGAEWRAPSLASGILKVASGLGGARPRRHDVRRLVGRAGELDMDHAYCIVSGGLDSVTLGYEVAREARRSTWLTFDYGQRHRCEIDHAGRAATAVGADWHVIDLRAVGMLLGPNALTGGAPVPHGGYDVGTMNVTVVPNRNAIMLAIAFGAASGAGADIVATAVHAGDHHVYPDCRPAFIDAFAAMQSLALDGLTVPRLHAPYVRLSKAEIVGRGAKVAVPFADTWSCYKGGNVHCGRCGTCIERREAFKIAGVPDPTTYA